MNGKSRMLLRGDIQTPPMSEAARREAGFLLRRLQQGEMLGLPHSRPMARQASAEQRAPVAPGGLGDGAEKNEGRTWGPARSENKFLRWMRRRRLTPHFAHGTLRFCISTVRPVYLHPSSPTVTRTGDTRHTIARDQHRVNVPLFQQFTKVAKASAGASEFPVGRPQVCLVHVTERHDPGPGALKLTGHVPAAPTAPDHPHPDPIVGAAHGIRPPRGDGCHQAASGQPALLARNPG
jgi:hypothetical protein